MAKNAEKSEEKGKKDRKGKKDHGEQAAGASVANHPRARAAVRRAKGWGGLIGFAVAAYLSFKAGVPAADAALRALAAGIVGRILAWGCAVAVWRHLVVAELRAAYERGAVAPGAGGEAGSSAG